MISSSFTDAAPSSLSGSAEPQPANMSAAARQIAIRASMIFLFIFSFPPNPIDLTITYPHSTI